MNEEPSALGSNSFFDERPILDQIAFFSSGFCAWAAPSSKLKLVSLSASLLLAVTCLVLAQNPLGLALGLLSLLIVSSLTIIAWRVGFWVTVNVNEGTLLVRDVRGLDRALTYSGSLEEFSRAETVAIDRHLRLWLFWQDQETPPLVIAFDSPTELSRAAELLRTAEIEVYDDAQSP
jgi:hypothetical protein